MRCARRDLVGLEVDTSALQAERAGAGVWAAIGAHGLRPRAVWHAAGCMPRAVAGAALDHLILE